MTEKPLIKLTRLVGGAAMLPGPLGYKVLGQLLISGSKGAEVAGANVVLAAVSRQSNAAAQVAVRSMVPAVLVEVLSRKEQQRLQRLIETQKKLRLQQLESGGLLTDVLMQSQRPDPSDEVMKTLQRLLGDYVPAPTAAARQRLNVEPAVTEPMPEPRPDPVLDDSPVRQKTPGDGDRKPDANVHAKALLKIKQPKKKGKSTAIDKKSD